MFGVLFTRKCHDNNNSDYYHEAMRYCLFRWLHEETYIRLPNLAMRYCLSNVEFHEPIYIDACQRANDLVTIKYHLCRIIALFEYACEFVICFFDFVLVQALVYGKVPVG
jgi:hypothetical protein